MNRVQIEKKGTKRRGFVKSAAAGAGGVALTNSFWSALRPAQGGLIAATPAESKY